MLLFAFAPPEFFVGISRVCAEGGSKGGGWSVGRSNAFPFTLLHKPSETNLKGTGRRKKGRAEKWHSGPMSEGKARFGRWDRLRLAGRVTRRREGGGEI